MDVGLHHRGVDAQLLAVFQAELDRGLDHGLVDGLHGGRGEPVKGTVEGVVVGHAMAVQVGKAAQGIAVVDAYPQRAIVPILTRMRMRERKVCAGVMPLRPVLGFFNPRARSWRTCSTSGAPSCRNPTMPCGRGSRWMPWFRNSRSAKRSWGAAIGVMIASPDAGVVGSTRRCAPRWP